MNERRTLSIRKFNPGLLQSDKDVIDQFVVRHLELDTVLQLLRENINCPSCQHVLIVAPRGRGKTMLLARVSAELRIDNECPNCLVPVRFMEESHEIHTPADFWLEALFYLSLEIATSNPELSQELREAHIDLKSRWRERELVERARATILEAAEVLDKQLVLMVENLQAISEVANDDFGWTLRQALQSEPRIMLLATATSHFDALVDASQAFFELFRTIYLDPLNTESCQRLWQALSGNERSEKEIRPLQILTGGNPRLLVIIAQFAGHRSLRRLMNELVMLIDDHTEYFRSHLEGFAKTERRVYLAVIDLWQPSSTGEIAERAALDVRTVSTMLGRLVDRGAVAVEGSRRKRRYAATERLYCIYYKLRRERDEAAIVANLIHFMSVFYGGDELIMMAESLNDEASESPAIREGIKRAIAEEPKLSGFLSGEVRLSGEIQVGPEPTANDTEIKQVFVEALLASKEGQFHKVIELLDVLADSYQSNLPLTREPVICEMLLAKAQAYIELGMRDAAIRTYEEVVEQFGVSALPIVQAKAATALIYKGVTQGLMGETEEEIATYGEVTRRFGNSTASEVLEQVAKSLLYKGITQAAVGESDVAIATYDELAERFGTSDIAKIQEEVAKALVNKCVTQARVGKPEAAIETVKEVVKRFGASEEPGILKQVARALVNRAVAQSVIGEIEEAIGTYDKVVDRLGSSANPEVQEDMAKALVNKGILQGQMGMAEGEIATYSEVVKRFKASVAPAVQAQVGRALVYKGITQGQIGEPEREIATYDEVVERFENSVEPEVLEQVARALVNKGISQGGVGEAKREIATYDEVVKRFGNNAEPEVQEQVVRALVYKGITQGQLGESEREIAAYDEVVERFGASVAPAVQAQVARAMVYKGITQGEIGESEREIATYNEAIKRFGAGVVPEVQIHVARALFNKGIAQSQIGESEAVIATYDEVVMRFGSSAVPEVQEQVAKALVAKGVLQSRTGESEKEIATYDEVVERFGSSAVLEVQEQVARALLYKGITQRQIGHGESEIATYDEVVERFGASVAPEIQVQVVRAAVNKGIAQRQLGQSEAAIATWNEIQKRFGAESAPKLQEQVARALLLESWEEIAMGRADVALSICDELDKRLVSQAPDEADSTQLHAKFVRIQALLSLQDLESAKDSLNSAYSIFNPDSDMAVHSMLTLVIDLVASGVSERELVDVLTEDSTKSEKLAPLVIALRQRAGEVVRAPAEMLEVAADIDRRIDERNIATDTSVAS